VADKLGIDEALGLNQYLTSADGRFTFIMQGDGNLVLYKGGIGNVVKWASNTYGRQASRAIMQSDGNFVIYAPNGPAFWATGTNGSPGATLLLQNDGNVVIYRPDGQAIWATGTNEVGGNPAGPIELTEGPEEVGNRKSMTTKAILYRNGLLTCETFSRSRHLTEGLRGRVLVVCIDDQGRGHWVSDEMACITVGGQLDPTTPSARTDSFTEQLPEPVGRLTARIDIMQASGPLGDSKKSLMNAIQTGKDVYEELKPLLGLMNPAAGVLNPSP